MTTSTETKLRRGTASQIAAMTPAQGEVVMNTTDNTLHAGNGSTAGGIKLPNAPIIQKQSFIYATVGGASDAITLTNTPAIAAYTAGMKQVFKAGAANTTTSVTVDVDGLGAKNLKKISGGALVALDIGDIVSGGIYELVYDGTQFQIGGGIKEPSRLPAAVVGTLSGSSVTFAVDFATYSAYDLIIENCAANAGASALLVDLSSNAGAGYATPTRSGKIIKTATVSSETLTDCPIGNSAGEVSHFHAVISQYSASGAAGMSYAGGSSASGSGSQYGSVKFATSATVNMVKISANAATFAGGNVILQPKSAR